MKVSDFIQLDDPKGPGPWFIREEAISAIHARRDNGTVRLLLTGSQEVHLGPEESRQFLEQVKGFNWQLEAS
jgi:hypothetical protein